MPIELAAALAGIATRTLVIKLLDGNRPDPNAWAGIAGQIVETIVGATSRQASELDELGGKVDALGGKVDALGWKVDALPAREFGQHMTAGCRHLRDLSVSRRTRRDRRDLIRDARGEFVRASAVAAQMRDIQRQATAEVAIAGCWLWVPSIPDVTNTLDNARILVEKELLFGAVGAFSGLSSSYRDIVTLCKSYRVPATLNAGPLIVPSNESSPIPGARVAVRILHSEPIWCAGIELMTYPELRPVKLNEHVRRRLRENNYATPGTSTFKGVLDHVQQHRNMSPAPLAQDLIPAVVHNYLDRWISVSSDSNSVIIYILEQPPNPTLGYHVAPRAHQQFRLTFADSPAITRWDIPATPAVGFLMPSRDLLPEHIRGGSVSPGSKPGSKDRTAP
jgi:hypothetical protein